MRQSFMLILILMQVLFANSYTEPPFFPSDSLSGLWLLSANDGFGHNFGVDEDNLRTFGINAGAVIRGKFLLSGDLYSLTDRNSVDSLSLRNDELKLTAAYRIFDKVLPSGIQWTNFLGIGALLYGDFGSSQIQENAHSLGDAEGIRPVTHTYDTSSGAGIFYTSSALNASKWELLQVNQLSTSGALSTSLKAGYWHKRELLQLQYYMKAILNKYDKHGSVVENVYEAENGIWLGTKSYIGPAVLERAFNLNSLNQYSFVGIRLQKGGLSIDGTTPFPVNYSIGWPIGHNSWIEFFRMNPFLQNPRLGLFFRTYHTENVYPNNTTEADDDRLVRRIKVASLGAEYALHPPAEDRVINGFLFGGAGFNREMIATYDKLASRFLTLNTFPIIHTGIGIRAVIPNIKKREKWMQVGVEVRANGRYSFGEPEVYSNPDLLLSWGLFFGE